MLLLNQSRLSQAFGDSAMERLKHAVIEQELTFRNQVRELHRLYWTQKNLMNELSRARKGGDMSDRNAGAFVKNHQRSLNLHLPADDFISGADDELEGQKPHGYGAGFDDFSVSAVDDPSSNKKHESGPVLIDLNLPHEDNKTCLDLVNIAFPSRDSSIVCCGILEPETTEISPDKFSFATKPDSANPAAKASCEKGGECLFLCGKGSNAHDSQVSLPTDNNGKDNSRNENKMDINFLAYGKENVDSQSQHSDSKRQDSNITTCSSINLPENDTSSSHASAPGEPQEDALIKQLSFGYNSTGISSKSECSSCEKGAGEPAALSIIDDSIITQAHSSKLGEINFAIEAAAEVLMTISFGRSDNTQLAEVQCMGRKDQPQHSSDSFELMTMHLSEVVNEEKNHITAAITSFSKRGKEKLRLRRGRRLRDFRKEILPGLLPLSRLEICEDMYSIGYELRKKTATSARGYCFVPVRRRRSRLASGRRRS